MRHSVQHLKRDARLQLPEREKDLEYELFDGDEKLVGKHDKLKALELELRSVETTLNRLIAIES